MNHLRSPRNKIFLPLIAYCFVCLVIFSPLIKVIDSHILADDIFIRYGESDAYNFLWGHWWVQESLFKRDILFSNWIFPPDGVDLRHHTLPVLPALLTYPLSHVFGPVTTYNISILVMFVAGAYMYYLFARKTFAFSVLSSFIAGLLFSFSPYFIFKAHAHPNLIGHFFWGGALAILIFSYSNNLFSLKRGISFSLLYWATLFTSQVEFFMLGVSTLLVILTYEFTNLFPFRQATKAILQTKISFFIPTLFGVPLLLLLIQGGDEDLLYKNLFHELSVLQLFSPYKLSVLGANNAVMTPEYWGTSIPISMLVLSLLGLISSVMKTPKYHMIPLMILVTTFLIITTDAYSVPSTLLRVLPFGEGFRVIGRFFSFFLFFMCIFLTAGVHYLFSSNNRTIRGVIIALACLGIVESYPYHINASKVAKLDIPKEIISSMDPQQYIHIVPDKSIYRKIYDTYQIEIERPVTRLSYVARGGDVLLENLRKSYPAIYSEKKSPFNNEFLKEAKMLHISYILFTNKSDISLLEIPHTVIWETEKEVLVLLPEN